MITLFFFIANYMAKITEYENYYLIKGRIQKNKPVCIVGLRSIGELSNITSLIPRPSFPPLLVEYGRGKYEKPLPHYTRGERGSGRPGNEATNIHHGY